MKLDVFRSLFIKIIGVVEAIQMLLHRVFGVRVGDGSLQFRDDTNALKGLGFRVWGFRRLKRNSFRS